MEIRSIRHKGLRRLVEKNNPGGLPPDYVAKIADIMSFLIDMENIEEVFDLQKYKPHLLSGNRAGTYSFHVTPNWRIIPKLDELDSSSFGKRDCAPELLRGKPSERRRAPAFEAVGDRLRSTSLGITFRHDAETNELYDVDYEDYH